MSIRRSVTPGTPPEDAGAVPWRQAAASTRQARITMRTARRVVSVPIRLGPHGPEKGSPFVPCPTAPFRIAFGCNRRGREEEKPRSSNYGGEKTTHCIMQRDKCNRMHRGRFPAFGNGFRTTMGPRLRGEVKVRSGGTEPCRTAGGTFFHSSTNMISLTVTFRMPAGTVKNSGGKFFFSSLTTSLV